VDRPLPVPSCKVGSLPRFEDESPIPDRLVPAFDSELVFRGPPLRHLILSHSKTLTRICPWIPTSIQFRTDPLSPALPPCCLLILVCSLPHRPRHQAVRSVPSSRKDFLWRQAPRKWPILGLLPTEPPPLPAIFSGFSPI